MDNKTKSKKHWLVLLMASSLSASSLGLVLNTVGIFIQPMADSLGYGIGTLAVHSTMVSISIAVFSLFFASFNHKLGWKKTLIIGLTMAFLGTAPMGLTSNILVIYFLGALRGAGTAFFAQVPMTIIINNWFDEKNGLALSIANATGGLVGALLAPVLTWIISSYSWQMAFLVKGILIVILALPAVLYSYSLSPKEDGYLPYGYKEVAGDVSGAQGLKGVDTFKYASVAFITLIIFAILHGFVIGFANHMSPYGQSVGIDFQTTGVIVSALMVGNIAFKLLGGVMSDAMGVVKATLIITIVNALGIAFMVFGAGNIIMMLIGSFLFGSIYVGPSITFAVLPKEFFGREVANRIFPFISFTLNIATAAGITLIGFAFDFAGSYLPLLILFIGVHGLNMILMFAGYKASKGDTPAY